MEFAAALTVSTRNLVEYEQTGLFGYRVIRSVLQTTRLEA